MNRTIVAVAFIALLGGCATTEFKTYEGKSNIFEGQGGTKVVVDGMEIWDNGDPPRKFKVLGILDDVRPGGVIPMAQLRGDMVKKAREAGGDAVIKLSSNSQVMGYYNTGRATANTYGNTTYVSGSSVSMGLRKNFASFAVIKYLD